MLEMKFAGGLVKHLGLQMYSGAVPAIAELISNAWDADAESVRVSIPLDEAVTAEHQIVIQDDGRGMGFDEINDKYLLLGRDRRAADGDHTAGGRLALGRKGIGKLAGFGIAKVVEVWTVKEGRLTAFSMDYDKITGPDSKIKSYRPDILCDRPVVADDDMQVGTKVVLARLQLKQRVTGERFRLGMTRRFSLLSASFRVEVNDLALMREEQPLQFRFPKHGWETDDVPGLGTVRWWAGFTEKPIQVDEARGITVLARGKVAQVPFFFEMSGGTQNQLGMQYLTGEVIADNLDSEGADLIATDRATVLWEHPQAAPLLEWGQKRIRHLLREWSRLRQESHFKRLREKTKYMEAIEKFPPREQKELLSAIDRLTSMGTMESDRLDEIVRILLHAYENNHFFDLIRALREVDSDSQDELLRLLKEWDVLEAVQTAYLVRGRVELIHTFGAMIRNEARENPDMQELLARHPWLINPTWQMMHREKSLENVLEQSFGVAKDVQHQDRRRLDFLCIGNSAQAVVVEIKRPGILVGVAELRQLEDYVNYLQTWNGQSTGGLSKRSVIEGVLIYSRMDELGRNHADRLRQAGMNIVTWDSLLETAERLHREYLDLVKSRAPQEDPRIQALNDIDESGSADAMD
jgi:RecB family endonuclease NucS